MLTRIHTNNYRRPRNRLRTVNQISRCPYTRRHKMGQSRGLHSQEIKIKTVLLTQLKKSGLSSDDLLCFYKSVIRTNLEYAAPVFGTSLPDYLSDNIESVQKRALRIIYPELSYNSSICQSQLNLLRLREEIYAKT